MSGMIDYELSALAGMGGEGSQGMGVRQQSAQIHKVLYSSVQ
jgi:hypothetical protein